MIESCLCCGSTHLAQTAVLWDELIDAWRLAPHEVEYVNRQQGLHCVECGSSLRSMALARAILQSYGFAGLLKDFVGDARARSLRVLEINAAGNLTPFLETIPGHLLTEYPEVDMTRLPFDDATYDLVVHSDTLEHIPDPVRGLSECRRVLKPGGFCAFTIPVIVDRLTRSREGLPPSYHGVPGDVDESQRVRTEYGADAWKHVILAGFRECRIVSLDYPAAQAFIGAR